MKRLLALILFCASAASAQTIANITVQPAEWGAMPRARAGDLVSIQVVVTGTGPTTNISASVGYY